MLAPVSYRRVLIVLPLLASLFLIAQDAKYATLPDKIVTARTVYLENDGRQQKFTDKMYEKLKEWGRWRIVTNRAEADIVISLDHRDRLHNYFFMRVLDRESGDLLWTAKRDVQIGTLGGTAKALLADLEKRMPQRVEGK
jgi:hypothetical protein